MGLPLFWLFVLAACLLWSATFTAAAARSATFPSLLSFAGWFIPLLFLLPAVWLTGWLAFGPRPFDVNHFAATLTLALAALVGGVWIVIAGRRTAADGTPVARRWPVIGLAGLCGMAALVAYGTLVAVDNAVAAEAAQARAEAAALMQANLPPAVAEADNAAPLHRHAAALLAAEEPFKTDFPDGDPDSPLDIRSPEVAARLARHADTLDLIRRAADKNACRFDRDWSRPSIDMILPEIQSLRGETRLLALAARRAAADGDAAAALADTVRIHRIARQAAAEPILISHLVAQAIDALARDTLALVLPSLDADDVALLDDPGLDGLVGPPPPLLKYMLGEETLGLSVFADIATGRMRMATLDTNAGAIADRVGLLYRTLFLPTELAAYRELLDGFQQACAQNDQVGAAWDRVTGDEQSVDRRGVLSSMLAPSLPPIRGAQVRAEAGARAARVLIAATKRRLAGAGLPESLDELVPTWLSAVPRDPFTDKQPLHAKPVEGGMLVWWVGPDGEDDGGPTGRDSYTDDIQTGNDDLGLWMVPDRPRATPVEAASE
ncbi:MAG: hypothetical protein FJ309_04175 [Planctomycetes bacterium]|nr:hypothetical protein [Planctomycetota bacterium]